MKLRRVVGAVCCVPRAAMTPSVGSSMLAASCRTALSSTALPTMQFRSCATGTQTTASSGAKLPDGTSVTALDVAMNVNKIKRLHQAGGDRKALEAEAWTALNTLSEEQIMHADGKAVALLLNTWAYFSKSWENGRDGPSAAGGDSADSSSSSHTEKQ